MHRRIALKRLTASDLTLFEWQFRNRPTGNQKSINLNTDVFIDELYPSLPEIATSRNNRIPLDLSIYGPGHSGLHNLQRKILKGSAYKNWRLDGEYINNPDDEPERYNVLQPGDIAVFDFSGTVVPDAAKLVLISQELDTDQVIHMELSALLGARSMAAVSLAQLQAVTDRLTDDAHPFHELTLDAELEDAALGGVKGITALHRSPSTRVLSRDELQRALRAAEEVGRAGEELIYQYLSEQKAKGAILDFAWASDANAVAPYDFLIILPDKQEIAIDAKSTSGEFERPLHISTAELIEMTGKRLYDIYRVFEVSDSGGNLCIAENVRAFADAVLKSLDQLPKGVQADSVSVDISALKFGPALALSLPDPEEE